MRWDIRTCFIMKTSLLSRRNPSRLPCAVGINSQSFGQLGQASDLSWFGKCQSKLDTRQNIICESEGVMQVYLFRKLVLTWRSPEMEEHLPMSGKLWTLPEIVFSMFLMVPLFCCSDENVDYISLRRCFFWCLFLLLYVPSCPAPTNMWVIVHDFVLSLLFILSYYSRSCVCFACFYWIMCVHLRITVFIFFSGARKAKRGPFK